MTAKLQDIENEDLFLKGWLAEKFVYRFKVTLVFFIKDKMGVNFQ